MTSHCALIALAVFAVGIIIGMLFEMNNHKCPKPEPSPEPKKPELGRVQVWTKHEWCPQIDCSFIEMNKATGDLTLRDPDGNTCAVFARNEWIAVLVVDTTPTKIEVTNSQACTNAETPEPSA